MAWPKGQKRHTQDKKVETIVDNPPEDVKKPEIAPFDTCRYHNDLEPRVFKKGEIIPEGWEESQANLGVTWTHDFTLNVWNRTES